MRPYEIRYRFRASGDDDVCRHLHCACWSPILHNESWLVDQERAGRRLPCSLLDLGIQYVSPPGCEGVPGRWLCQPLKLAPDIIEARRATCIDIVCYTCAWLRVHGVDARPLVVPTEVPDLYHVMVQVDGYGQPFDVTQDLIDGVPRVASFLCSLVS